MARSWFTYIPETCTESEIKNPRNYIRVGALFHENGRPVNICGIYATVSLTQPILTPNLIAYLNVAAVYPCSNQPLMGIKKYVYTRPQ